MSGPKVVRIVTAEEYAQLEAQRDRLLAELDALIGEWKACLQQLGLFDQLKYDDIRGRARSLRENFFPNFDKNVRASRDQMKHLNEEMREAVVQAKALAKQRRRKLAEAGLIAMDRLAQSGMPIPPILEEVIKQAESCSDEQVRKYQQAVDKALAATFQASEEKKAALTGEQKELLAALGQGLAPTASAASLSAGREVAQTAISRLDRLWAQLEVFGEKEMLSKCQDRMGKIAAERSETRREMLTDSLVIEMAEACKKAAEHGQIVELVKELRFDLSPQESSVRASYENELEKLVALSDIKAAQDMAQKLRSRMVSDRARPFANKKRAAILAALSDLGYEVREGMDTAWAKDGKLVLSKKATPGLGLELGSPDSVERMQMRAVRIKRAGGVLDQTDGKVVETKWCSELSDLRAALSKSGHESEIDSATPAGAVPLKVCELTAWLPDSDAEDSVEDTVRNSNYRTI